MPAATHHETGRGGFVLHVRVAAIHRCRHSPPTDLVRRRDVSKD